jgi:hypothetical protein
MNDFGANQKVGMMDQPIFQSQSFNLQRFSLLFLFRWTRSKSIRFYIYEPTTLRSHLHFLRLSAHFFIILPNLLILFNFPFLFILPNQIFNHFLFIFFT